ncbi:unnamed protein product [Amoebophrya sp. A25]|nr:unnamed protein product [Amoebophrya sp. A25]|eukprot:GSA25T00015862001.1
MNYHEQEDITSSSIQQMLMFITCVRVDDHSVDLVSSEEPKNYQAETVPLMRGEGFSLTHIENKTREVNQTGSEKATNQGGRAALKKSPSGDYPDGAKTEPRLRGSPTTSL